MVATDIVAAFTRKCWMSAGVLKVLVPETVTTYVSMVALTGIFQLAVITPPSVAGAVCENTRVDEVCVLMFTLTLSEALYPLAWTLTV